MSKELTKMNKCYNCIHYSVCFMFNSIRDLLLKNGKLFNFDDETLTPMKYKNMLQFIFGGLASSCLKYKDNK